MFESPVTKKTIFLTVIASLFICLLIFFNNFFDERTKIVFCDVGQGDAAYIRIKNKIDVLIDAGPDKSVLSCLGKYMPFWDRKIELAFLSHPNTDHYNGYFYIIDRYKVDKFITVNTSGLIVSKTYKKLLKKISENNITLLFKVAGDQIRVQGGQFILYWPHKDFYSPHDNDYSQVILFKENDFRLLFTGDASPFVLGRLSHGAIEKVDILKVPHHGSKNGLTKKFLDLADPEVAVISVGKNNSYGHPSKKVLEMLEAHKVKVKRTDVDGDIVFNLKE
ncbi:ComE-like protein, Metallo beta-lactamase superfamily hydrolase [Candidatus Roizmanbacteria bacterium]|nr:ComE-like protein, Metallo beta-lactamase superfamily hydrolase [Candidatus Roizmanbacteria bacterium]